MYKKNGSLEKFLTENIDTQAAQEKVLKKDLQSEVDGLARRYPAPPPRNPNITQETMDRVGPMTAPKYKDPRIVNSGLPAAAPPPSNRAPNNPVGGANQTGAGLQAAAQTSNNPYMKKLEDLINKEPVKPTEEGALESVRKLTPEAMGEEAMKKRFADQRARGEQERSAYENSRPSGLDELIRVLGQSGQYKGLSGMAPAYTAMQRQNRAEDLAMEQRQNSLMTAIEKREYDRRQRYCLALTLRRLTMLKNYLARNQRLIALGVWRILLKLLSLKLTVRWIDSPI
jgi:hypothetical protein